MILRLLITILFVFISFNCFSQQFEISNGDTINRIDIKGKKQGKWIEFHGEVGRSEYFFTNDIKNGEYFWYDKNGLISEKGIYLKGKTEGISYTYKNGKLETIRYYKNDKLSSQIVFYYENGKPKNGGDYFWGKGEKILYDSTGLVLSRYIYKNFRLNGNYGIYFKNGQLKEKGKYKNDKYWTVEARFDSLGNTIKFGNLKKGNGEVYFYEANGKFKIEEYKHGKLWNIIKYKLDTFELLDYGDFRDGNGIVKEYYSNGNLKSIVKYENGKLNGSCKFFYGTNGMIVGLYKNDNKEGKWYRYINGRITNIEDYKKNRSVGIACF